MIKPGIAEGATRKIIGGSVDGTAPTTLPVPGDGGGTLLSTAGVIWSSEGSFYGTTNVGCPTFICVRKSTDSGSTWANQNTVLLNMGVINVSSTVLLALGDTAGFITTRMLRSTDEGVTFTTVYNVGSNVGNTQRRSIAKDTSTSRWWAAYGTGANSDVIFSTDDGVNWTVSDTGANFCGSGAAGIVASSSTIIVGSGVQSAPACTEEIRVSTNNGTSWSSVSPDCTPTAGERNFSSPIVISGTFYISVMGNSGQGCVLSSSDGTTWAESADMPFTNPSSAEFGSLGSFNDNVNNFLYLAIRDLSASSVLKVYRTPAGTNSFASVFNTAVNQTPGNLLGAADNKIYFGTSTDRFYRLD